ncbi:MAG: NfeD family protein [Bdellovibrionia bacterium]
MGRFFRSILAGMLLLVGLTPSVQAADEVRLLTINGVISPVTSRYLKRELNDAARSNTNAVIVSLDSPGGLERSMREIVIAILNSPVPVIIYVSPSGARAASAGMFITIAGSIAAMAPGTNIGAAHPVTLGGGDETSTTMEKKVLNDVASFARSIAAERGRNSDWVQEAVINSASITAREAEQLGVIDFQARDLKELLERSNGKIVETPSGKITLKTSGLSIVDRPMSLPERLLETLTDPTIAYILVILGFIGIIAEFYHPGTFVPGTVGALSLLLGYIALGSLPINWVGVFLLIIGIGLLIAELHYPTLGALGTAGLCTFIIGSLLLYRPFHPVSPTMPLVRLNLWALAAMSALVAGFFLGVLRLAWAARHRPVMTGPEALIGMTAIAESDLRPKGVVNLKGERWTAESESPNQGRVIHAGERVEVSGVRGVTLKVRATAQAGGRSRPDLKKSKWG